MHHMSIEIYWIYCTCGGLIINHIIAPSGCPYVYGIYAGKVPISFLVGGETYLE